jgi:hypothetical protein
MTRTRTSQPSNQERISYPEPRLAHLLCDGCREPWPLRFHAIVVTVNTGRVYLCHACAATLSTSWITISTTEATYD